MENSQHNSPLRQKLDQHDLGYRPGAWENFEQMLVANPVVAPKKQFWDFKKWLGIGSAAALISASVLFFNQENANVQTPVLAAPTISTTQENQTTNEAAKTNITTTKSEKNTEKVMSVSAPISTTTEKSAEHLSQNDDNSQPHEVELKLRPVQPAQRASKSGSDDSAVLPTSSKKNENDHSVKKNTIDQSFHKAPDAHELDENTSAPKKKN
jgi:hypothetical protein